LRHFATEASKQTLKKDQAKGQPIAPWSKITRQVRTCHVHKITTSNCCKQLKNRKSRVGVVWFCGAIFSGEFDRHEIFGIFPIIDLRCQRLMIEADAARPKD